MILATHAIAGAAIANLIPTHPILGFTAGFASHFVLDAIPHWHYQLHSRSHDDSNPLNGDILINKDFPLDLLRISSDGIVGIAIALAFFQSSSPVYFSATVLGAIGGMLPDALQFVYFKWRHEPLVTLQRFHIWIHAKKSLDQYPIWGPFAQIVFGICCILIVQ